MSVSNRITPFDGHGAVAPMTWHNLSGSPSVSAAARYQHYLPRFKAQLATLENS